MSKEKIYKELFVLVIKETSEILTPDSFTKYWKGYGKSDMYGWRPPKKIYYTLGGAKSGFNYIPDEIKPKITISKFVRGEDIISGSDLMNKQESDKKKRKQKEDKRIAEYRLRMAIEDVKNAQDKLKQLTK